MLVDACEALAQKHKKTEIGIGVGLSASYGAAQRLYIKKGYLPDGAGVCYDDVPVSAGDLRPLDGLLTLWRGRCAISGLNVPELLRASHAKPWAASTDAERLDVYNGLLLAAHLDAAFDCGLITVEADGAISVSSSLPVEALSLLHLHAGVRITLSPRHEPYMAWHRECVFRR